MQNHIQDRHNIYMYIHKKHKTQCISDLGRFYAYFGPVAVLTNCRRFGVAVLTCRRFDHRPVPSYHTRLDAAFFCLHSLLLDSSSAAVPRKLSDSSP